MRKPTGIFSGRLMPTEEMQLAGKSHLPLTAMASAVCFIDCRQAEAGDGQLSFEPDEDAQRKIFPEFVVQGEFAG